SSKPESGFWHFSSRTRMFVLATSAEGAVPAGGAFSVGSGYVSLFGPNTGTVRSCTAYKPGLYIVLEPRNTTASWNGAEGAAGGILATINSPTFFRFLASLTTKLKNMMSPARLSQPLLRPAVHTTCVTPISLKRV